MSDPSAAPLPRRVSMESIAQELGVSVATISRALNGKPGISGELRAKVEERLKAHAYHPRRSRPVSERGSSRVHTVAFVVSDDLLTRITQGDDFYGRHLVAVQKAISDAGLYPLLIGYQQDLDENGMLRCVAEKRVQAIIGESWSPELAERIAKEVPVVLFNRTSSSAIVDTIATDIHAATQEQLEHLYDLGHRRFGAFRITPPACGWENTCFWQQYFSFHMERGLPLPPEWLEPVRFGQGEHEEAAVRYVERMLSRPQRPTALLTYDHYAEALIHALEAKGLSVPGEMSVVGFNDLKTTPDHIVPLTTYRQDFDKMAAEALRLVLDRQANRDVYPRLVRLAGRLIVRQSAVPPPPQGRAE